MVESLRRRNGREEFDYAALMAALSGYAKPHDRVTLLLRRGDIVRSPERAVADKVREDRKARIRSSGSLLFGLPVAAMAVASGVGVSADGKKLHR